MGPPACLSLPAPLSGEVRRREPHSTYIHTSTCMHTRQQMQPAGTHAHKHLHAHPAADATSRHTCTQAPACTPGSRCNHHTQMHTINYTFVHCTGPVCVHTCTHRHTTTCTHGSYVCVIQTIRFTEGLTSLFCRDLKLFIFLRGLSKSSSSTWSPAPVSERWRAQYLGDIQHARQTRPATVAVLYRR